MNQSVSIIRTRDTSASKKTTDTYCQIYKLLWLFQSCLKHLLQNDFFVGKFQGASSIVILIDCPYKSRNRVVPLVADFPQSNSTTDTDTHLLGDIINLVVSTNLGRHLLTINHLMMTVLVKQSLALPRSAKKQRKKCFYCKTWSNSKFLWKRRRTSWASGGPRLFPFSSGHFLEETRNALAGGGFSPWKEGKEKTNTEIFLSQHIICVNVQRGGGGGEQNAYNFWWNLKMQTIH